MQNLMFSQNSLAFSMIQQMLSSLVAQRLKHLPAMQETRVRSLGQEDPLEKKMTTYSSILAWEIPWTEEPGGLQSTRLQRVGHDWATSLSLSLSVRPIPFLSFIVSLFAWNVPLGSLIFLKRSLVFPFLSFSSTSLHWSLRQAFLSLLVILWNSVFKWVYLSFSPLPLASLLFSAICKFQNSLLGVNDWRRSEIKSTSFYGYSFSSMRPKRMTFILLGFRG